MPIIPKNSLPAGDGRQYDSLPPGTHHVDLFQNVYRFSGYKLNRDTAGNILKTGKQVSQPAFWSTQAVSYGKVKLWSP